MFLVRKMLITEFKKLWTNKIFLVVAIVAFIINGVLILENVFNKESTAKVYKEYAGQLLSMELEEGSSYIGQELEAAKENMFHQLQEDDIEYEMVSLLNVRNMALNEIMQELNRNSEVNEVKKSLLSNLERAAQKSTGKWETEVYKKQYIKYSELGWITECYVPLRFTELFLDCFWSDVLILVVICMSVYVMTAYEKRKKYDVLIKTSKNSNKDYRRKIAVVLLSSVLITAMIYIERGIIIAANTVVPPFEAPAQLISVYCPYKINILGYLLLFVALKLFCFLLMAGFCFLIFVSVRNDFMALSGIAIVNVLFALLFLLIGENSVYSMLRTWNPYSLLNTETVLNRYDFVNVFGIPMPLIAVSAVIAVVLSGLLLFFSSIIYRRSSKTSRVFLTDKRQRHIKSTNMLGCELYNAFCARGGAAFLLLIIVIFPVVNQAVDTRFYSAEDYLTDFYSKEYAGLVSQEMFDAINERYEAATAAVTKSEDTTYLRIMSRIKTYADYLEANQYKYYISNRGFERLTCLNVDYNRRYLLQVSVTILFSCLFLIQVFGMDTSADNLLLINAAKNRAKSVKCRWGIVFAIFFTAYSVFVLPEPVKILHTFGYDYINAPAACLQHLSGIPVGISILVVILFKYIMVIPCAAVYLYLSEKLLKQIKNELGTAAITMLLVMLPAVLLW